MSQRKPMGAFWAILAVPDHVLSGRRSVLLARMFLLDNGTRGCNAGAAVLSQYTGLSERTVEKYRAELADLGLVYRVPGTRGWHVNLPSGLPPNYAKDAEILAYMHRIVAAIAPAESTPSGVVEADEKVRLPGSEVHPAVGESTPVGGTKYAQHRTDTEPESTPSGVESVVAIVTTPDAGLMSTHLTHDKGTHECDESHVEPTRENGNGNGVSQSGDVDRSAHPLLDLLPDHVRRPQPTADAEHKRQLFKAQCEALAKQQRIPAGDA